MMGGKSRLKIETQFNQLVGEDEAVEVALWQKDRAYVLSV